MGRSVLVCVIPLLKTCCALVKHLVCHRYYQNYALGVWLNGLEDDPSHPRRSDKKLVFFIVCCASVVLSVIVKNFYVAIGSLKASQVRYCCIVWTTVVNEVYFPFLRRRNFTTNSSRQCWQQPARGLIAPRLVELRIGFLLILMKLTKR